MLDPEAVERVDRSRMLDAVLRMGTVLEESLKSLEGLSLPFENPSTVVSAGMGGSAIAGEVIRCWLMYTSKTPVDVVRGYHLPAYVDEESLVVAVSYSGGTEETVSVLAEALKRGCMTVAVSSGGTVEKLSKTVGIPWIPVPKGLQPRAALPHLLAAQVKVLEAVGVEIPVEELLDLGFGKVRVVAALSEDIPVNTTEELRDFVARGNIRPLRVASEYTNIADKYLRDNHIVSYKVIPTWGASEAFLPDDADLLVDNTQTGKTLVENRLKIIDVILRSSACVIANRHSMEEPAKRDKIASIVSLLAGAIE